MPAKTKKKYYSRDSVRHSDMRELVFQARGGHCELCTLDLIGLEKEYEYLVSGYLHDVYVNPLPEDLLERLLDLETRRIAFIARAGFRAVPRDLEASFTKSPLEREICNEQSLLEMEKRTSMARTEDQYFQAMEEPRTHLWEIDHKVPYSDGGSHHHTNLRLLCVQCHKQITNIWVRTGQLVSTLEELKAVVV